MVFRVSHRKNPVQINLMIRELINLATFEGPNLKSMYASELTESILQLGMILSSASVI